MDPIDGSSPEDKSPIDQSEKPILEDDKLNVGTNNNDYGNLPPHPPLYVPSMKNNDYFNPAYNNTQPGVTRTCKKSVDLYVLQPNRLNMSGSFNPLKGKLTNCHATGCERYILFMINPIKLHTCRFFFNYYNVNSIIQTV